MAGKSRRNKNAGKSTGKSKSAKYFASHPAARAAKKLYDTIYHATTARKKYRAALNKKTRKNPTGTSVDNSHKKGGGTVREKRSTNRARQGKGGKSTKK